MNLPLSLIVATYNRAEWVIETLHSIAKQEAAADQWECLVVDNNSKDDTRERVEEFIALHPHLTIRYLFEGEQGLSHARNCGINNSVGDIIAIIDDDELLAPTFIGSYLTLFKNHPEVGAAGGTIIAQYRTARPSWMSHYPERAIANPMNFGNKERRFPRGRIPGGGNMALRRTTIQEHGVFNTDLGRSGTSLFGGEESEIFERLERGGVEWWYAPQATIYHLIPDEKLTPEYFERLCYNMGLSQRARARLAERTPFASEIAKWCATLPLALGLLLTLRPKAALYLLKMRWHITRGLFA